jgi:hypothetical protein
MLPITSLPDTWAVEEPVRSNANNTCLFFLPTLVPTHTTPQVLTCINNQLPTMSTTQSFPFFDLPKELRWMVYEHLDTQKCVVQQLPHLSTSQSDGQQTHSEDEGQVEFQFTNFAVGALATCKLMRDEVQPFFDKAYNTGELETIHIIPGDMHSLALEIADDALELSRYYHHSRSWDITLDEFKKIFRNVSLSTIPLRKC